MSTARDELLDRLADVACDLSSGQAEALALEFDLARSPRRIRKIGGMSAPSSVASLCESWKRTEVDGQTLADALRCASRAVKTVGSYEKVELLYTGPGADPIRRNQQALLEVIRGARIDLWVVSYAMGSGVDEVLDALEERARAAVEVRILIDHRSRMGAEAISRVITSAPGCTVLTWPDSKREIKPGWFANLHAKCAVADGRQAFVSSANLTGQAMDHNLEVGYLVTGGETPAELEGYLSGLLEDGILQPHETGTDE